MDANVESMRRWTYTYLELERFFANKAGEPSHVVPAGTQVKGLVVLNVKDISEVHGSLPGIHDDHDLSQDDLLRLLPLDVLQLHHNRIPILRRGRFHDFFESSLHEGLLWIVQDVDQILEPHAIPRCGSAPKLLCEPKTNVREMLGIGVCQVISLCTKCE
jgi:hypothetical protein